MLGARPVHFPVHDYTARQQSAVLSAKWMLLRSKANV